MPRHITFACLLLAALAAHAQPLGPKLPVAPEVDLSKLPPEAIIRLGSTHFYHDGNTTAAAFSPDSAAIATGVNNGFVVLWDVATGKELSKWQHTGLHHNPVAAISIQFAPGGKSLATSGQDGSLHVWDLAGHALYTRVTQRYEPIHFAWMPGNRIAWVTPTGIAILDVGAGKEVASWPVKLILPSNLVASPDGKRLIVREQEGKLRSFDSATGKEDVIYPNQANGPRYYRTGYQLAFLPDGHSLFAANTDMSFSIWDSNTGKQVRHIDAIGSNQAAALAPNGRFLALFGNDSRLRVFGLASGAELRSFETAHFGSNVLAFAPNSRYLAATLGGQGLHIWDVSTGDELHRSAGHRAPIQALAFLADGRLITAGQDQSLRCWDVKTGNELDRLARQTYVYQMVPTPDGKGVLLREGQYVSRWEPGSDHFVACSLAAPYTAGNSAIAPDGLLLAAFNGNLLEQHIKVLELPGGKELKQIPTPNVYPQALALSPGQRYLAYVENNSYGIVHVWDLQRGVARRPLVGDSGQMFYAERMLFSPDARLLVSVYSQRPTYVWESFTGLLRATLPLVNGSTSAAFSPNGRLLALGGSSGALTLYDLRTGNSAGPFQAHRGAVSGLAFTADGARLATGSQDSTAVIWDVAKLTAKLHLTEPVTVPSPAQLETWWNGLSAADGRAASEAIWSLAASPKSALRLFRAKLKPVAGVERATLDRWVADLDNPRYAVREEATHRLAAQGESARDALTAALPAAIGPEARFRLRRLLDVINSHFAPNRLQPLRALEVLEKIGGPEAREQLETLAKLSTDEEIRQEVQRVLERLREPAPLH